MFIPQNLKAYKPNSNPLTRCHTCVKGPHRKRTMLKVMEGPMNWHFCSEECGAVWHERRHDADAQAWFKVAKGVRAQLLNLKCDVPARSISAEDRSAFESIKHDPLVALSMQ